MRTDHDLIAIICTIPIRFYSVLFGPICFHSKLLNYNINDIVRNDLLHRRIVSLIRIMQMHCDGPQIMMRILDISYPYKCDVRLVNFNDSMH